MEENNRTAPTGEHTSEKPSNGEGRPKRHGHRGGRRHNHNKHREGAPAPEGAQVQQANPQPQKKQEPKSEAPAQESKKGGRNNKNRRGGKKGGDRRHNAGRDHVPQKDDIYGDPQEEKELAEWRAKIVLNAAPSPFAPVEEEPVELPPDIDLLNSDILTAPKKTDEEQIEVIGIRFRSAGKVYYFAPQGHKLKKGDFAIVETARGPEFGEVYLGNSKVGISETVTPLRPVIRQATTIDIQRNEENRVMEKEALGICQKKVAEHKLEMKLIDVQYAFDNSKLLFYFSSEGRVDFRELVKDLASVFRTRIELRQIGVRDEAKLLGGFGACGRVLCCSTFLPDFPQVSIKMAKEQGLSLNSAKISGICGRLMCCLRYESDVYAAENRLTPAAHSTVKTPDGIGTVLSTNPLAGTVRVLLKDTPDTPPKQYHRSEVTVCPKEKPAQEGASKKEGQ